MVRRNAFLYIEDVITDPCKPISCSRKCWYSKTALGNENSFGGFCIAFMVYPVVSHFCKMSVLVQKKEISCQGPLEYGGAPGLQFCKKYNGIICILKKKKYGKNSRPWWSHPITIFLKKKKKEVECGVCQQQKALHCSLTPLSVSSCIWCTSCFKQLESSVRGNEAWFRTQNRKPAFFCLNCPPRCLHRKQWKMLFGAKETAFHGWLCSITKMIRV